MNHGSVLAVVAALTTLSLAACGGQSSGEASTVTVTRTRPGAPATATGSGSTTAVVPVGDGARIPPAMNPQASAATLETTPPPTGTPRGQAAPSEADRMSAEAVATEFCRTIYVRDGATDTTTSDAVRRAAVWMTPELAQQVATVPSVRQDAVPGSELTAKQGYTTVTVEPDPEQRPGIPGAGQSPTRAIWGRVATIRYQSGNGWSAPLETRRCVVRLTRPGVVSPWAVSQIVMQ